MHQGAERRRRHRREVVGRRVRADLEAVTQRWSEQPATRLGAVGVETGVGERPHELATAALGVQDAASYPTEAGDDRFHSRTGQRRGVDRVERVRHRAARAWSRLLHHGDAPVEHPQGPHRRAAERAHLVREVLHVPEGELAHALLDRARWEAARRRRVDIDRHGLVRLAEHSGERVARHRVRRVVRELGVELGLEVSGQLAARAALGDRVVDLRDHEVQIDAVVRVAVAHFGVVRVAHPVTFTFTGSATVPVVRSGFITSNQCRCSLQS